MLCDYWDFVWEVKLFIKTVFVAFGRNNFLFGLVLSVCCLHRAFALYSGDNSFSLYYVSGGIVCFFKKGKTDNTALNAGQDDLFCFFTAPLNPSIFRKPFFQTTIVETTTVTASIIAAYRCLSGHIINPIVAYIPARA